jgi:hypothetical protein
MQPVRDHAQRPIASTKLALAEQWIRVLHINDLAAGKMAQDLWASYPGAPDYDLLNKPLWSEDVHTREHVCVRMYHKAEVGHLHLSVVLRTLERSSISGDTYHPAGEVLGESASEHPSKRANESTAIACGTLRYCSHRLEHGKCWPSIFSVGSSRRRHIDGSGDTGLQQTPWPRPLGAPATSSRQSVAPRSMEAP